MANALYDKGRKSFLAGELDWDADVIKTILVDTALYTVDLALHDFLDDVAAGSRVSTGGALTGKTTTDGVADATDDTHTAVSGATVEAIVIYEEEGTEATSRLIAFIDTATGLPLTPNGGDVTIQWDSAANRIFKL